MNVLETPPGNSGGAQLNGGEPNPAEPCNARSVTYEVHQHAHIFAFGPNDTGGGTMTVYEFPTVEGAEVFQKNLRASYLRDTGGWCTIDAASNRYTGDNCRHVADCVHMEGATQGGMTRTTQVRVGAVIAQIRIAVEDSNLRDRATAALLSRFPD